MPAKSQVEETFHWHQRKLEKDTISGGFCSSKYPMLIRHGAQEITECFEWCTLDASWVPKGTISNFLKVFILVPQFEDVGCLLMWHSKA